MGLPWTMRAARWVRRAALPLVVLGGFLLVRGYGFLAVPAGMDTLLATHPPGSTCFIEKWPSRAVPGSVVFVDLEDGGTLLARVAGVRADGRLLLAHDNPASSFAALQGEALGPVPVERVRGLVLVVLAPDPKVPDGR